jgi:integrase
MEIDVKRIGDYAGKHKENRTKIVEVEYKNEVKESEEGKLIEWTEMKQKFREYMNDESIPKKVNEVFMLGVLLLLEAPTRIGNYKDMRVVRVNPKSPEAIEDIDLKKNTLVVLEGNKSVAYQFIFGDYKTAKILGTVVVDVKDPLLKELATMMIMDMKETETILKVTGSYQTQLLRSITNKIYGVPFSVDMIRHSFATWFLKQTYSTQEKIDILKVFGNKYVPNQVDLYMRK